MNISEISTIIIESKTIIELRTIIISKNVSTIETSFKISKISQFIIKSRKCQNSTIITYVNYLTIKRQKLSFISNISTNIKFKTQTLFSSLEILQQNSLFIFNNENANETSKREIKINDFCFENKEPIIQKIMIKMKTKLSNKYRTLKCDDNNYVIDFIIRYLHSASKFETSTMDILFRIFVLSLLIKFINVLSNTTITKTIVSIAVDSIKSKK